MACEQDDDQETYEPLAGGEPSSAPERPPNIVSMEGDDTNQTKALHLEKPKAFSKHFQVQPNAARGGTTNPTQNKKNPNLDSTPATTQDDLAVDTTEITSEHQQGSSNPAEHPPHMTAGRMHGPESYTDDMICAFLSLH